MVVKKVQNRDDWRVFITRLNKVAGKVFNSSKLNSVEECKKYVLDLVKEIKNSSNKDLELERSRANAYWEECRSKERKIKKLEEEIAKIDNCKALYKEIDELKEEIEFKSKENSINEENIKALNSKIAELRRENFEQSNFKAGFILEAQNNKTELELQKVYKRAFAGVLIVSVLLNILLIRGNL